MIEFTSWDTLPCLLKVGRPFGVTVAITHTFSVFTTYTTTEATVSSSCCVTDNFFKTMAVLFTKLGTTCGIGFASHQ